MKVHFLPIFFGNSLHAIYVKYNFIRNEILPTHLQNILPFHSFKSFCHRTPKNVFAIPYPKFFAIYPLKLFLSHQLTKFVLRRHPQKYCYPNLKVFSQPIPKLICHPTRTTKKNSQSTPKLFCLLPLLKYLPPYYSKIILPPTTKIFYPTSQNVFVTYSQFFKTQLHQKYFAVQPQEFFATLPSNNFFGHQNILSTSSVPSSITSISCAHKKYQKHAQHSKDLK